MSTWLESVGLTTLTKMNKNIDSLRGELMSEISTARESAYYDGYTDAQGNDEPISGNYGTGYNSQTDRYSSHGRQPEVLPNEMFEIAWKLWQSSPVAKRTLTMKRDFIIGGNIAITAEGDKYQDIIDDLVDDDEEGLSFRFLREIALQACALGEQLIPAHVRHKSDGLVRYGYIDPERIYRPIYDPDNSRSCLGVVVIAPDSSEKASIGTCAK